MIVPLFDMLMCVAVACKTEADANLSLSQLSSWLQKRGLKFSAEKTRIINVEHGFDFLGFNVRLYAQKFARRDMRRAASPFQKIKTNPAYVRSICASACIDIFGPEQKLMIKPSKASQKKFRLKLKTTCAYILCRACICGIKKHS